MKMKKVIIALAVLAAVFAADSSLRPTLAAGKCRNAVVVYLDVSGSMYELKNMASLPWSNGRRLTLMENTIRFLRERLLAPQGGALKPGDRLTVRGFYSKVGALAGPLDPFDRAKCDQALARIDRQLDFNRNRRYDLADAKPKLNKFRRRNRFLADQRELVTDFLPLIRDMENQYRLTLQANPQGYDQLTYIILTDGEHENPADLDAFKAEIKKAGELMRRDRLQGRVKVLFFGLSLFGGQDKQKRNVTSDFQREFQAVCLELDPWEMNVAVVADQFRKLKKRIQIVEASRPRLDPREDNLLLDVHLFNPSCQDMVLEGVKYRFQRLPGADAEAEAEAPAQTPAARRTRVTSKFYSLALDKTVHPGADKEFTITIKDLPQLVELQEGDAVRLTLIPVTKGIGEGTARQTPPLEIPPDNSKYVILILVIILIGMGAFIAARLFLGGEDSL